MSKAWTRALIGAGALGAGGVIWSAIASRVNTALVPPDGRFIDVPGARLHYTDQGQGPVLLMIHGLMGQLRNFSYALTERLADDYRVICVDRPGWGHSTYTDTQPGIVAQAAIIADFIDALGLEAPTVVGHSLGGAVALALAVHHPGKAGRLALIAPLTQPVAVPPPMFAGMALPPGLRELAAWTIAIPMGTVTGLAVAKAIFAPDPVPMDFATRGGGALSGRPDAFRQGSFELMSVAAEMTALVPRYGELALPVSILFGKDDNVLNVEQQGRVTQAAIAGTELMINAGGHMLPVTWPLDTTLFVRRAAGRLI